MLKLDAIKSEKIWGYELWIASTHPNGCQDNFKDFCGGDYPLLIKVIPYGMPFFDRINCAHLHTPHMS